MPNTRLKIMSFTIPAKLNISFRDITESVVRKYAHHKGITLPGDIQYEVRESMTSGDAWHVTVYENPNTD